MPLHVKWRFLSVLFTLVANQAFAYQPIGRWAQYAALTRNGLFVYGGKTDQYNSYSYTSAPNSNDLLFLPLNNSFDSTSPPWELLIGSSNATEEPWPAVAWHTLSTINDSCFMLFGGQPDPNSATVLSGLPDSTSFLYLTDGGQPYWVPEPQSWGNQPTRRIRHSSTAVNSPLIFIIGGEKADGSANAYSDNYVFDINRSNFASLPNNTGPGGIFGHSSVVLSDGRLLVFGGYSQSRSLLVPLSEIWLLDTRGISSNWSLIEVSNASLPTPRRDFAATLLYNDKVLIHGGADAALQQNYADGWVLDTSVHPMTWGGVGTLSQLGPRRNHFAVSSGNQVLFGFGYGNSGPATPGLYIYDPVKDAFVTTYSLSPSLSATLSTPNPTSTRRTPDAHGGSSRTGSGSSSISTGASDFPSSSKGGSKSARNTALAITFSVLGAILVIIILYYLRRRHRQHGRGRRFVSLADDDTGSSRSHTIPTVVMIDEEPHTERRSGFSIFHALRLAGTRMNASGTGPEKPSARRRDMLADEDVYDREWYHLRRARGAEHSSSWSFRSFVSGYLRGQEPSGTSESIRFHNNEASDPFLDDGIILNGAEPSGDESLSQLHHRHRQGRYGDPFAEAPKQEEDGALSDTLPTSARLLPSHPFVPQYNSPPKSNAGRVSPPTSQSSDPYDISIERSDPTFRSARSPNSPEIASPSAYATSLINANRGPLQPISRTDSWWRRFTRNSFLDRKLSSTSRKSPSMDLKEHNIPLMSIGEQTDSLALKTVARKSVEVIDHQPESQNVADFYEGCHNGRSLSSFATADTEAVERIGRIIDVVQRVRTSSHQSSSSSADHASFEERPPESKPDDPDDLSASEDPTASSTRVELSDMDPFNNSGPLSPLSENVEMASATSTCTSGSGLVAARVRDYERRLSQDNEGPRKTKRDGDVAKVKYGLAPRQSLFIANPDMS